MITEDELNGIIQRLAEHIIAETGNKVLLPLPPEWERCRQGDDGAWLNGEGNVYDNE